MSNSTKHAKRTRSTHNRDASIEICSRPLGVGDLPHACTAILFLLGHPLGSQRKARVLSAQPHSCTIAALSWRKTLRDFA